MNRETISHKRLWAWLAAAMSAPLAHFSGSSWLGLLAAGLICGSVTALLPANWEGIRTSRFWCAVQLIWIMVLLAQLIPLSAPYWPGPKSQWIVPLTLLAVGAYSCTRRPSRASGVLFWILIIMYVPVLIAGVKDVEIKWLLPNSVGISAWLIPVLLLPCAAKWLGAERGEHRWYFGILTFGVFFCMITSGVLSPGIAAAANNPMRELSRSLTIGAASRFESLVSVMLTIGWFSLASLLIRIGSVHCESLGIRKKFAPWIVALGSVLVSWTGVQQNGIFSAVFTTFLWVLVPLLQEKKFSKKIEKSA